MAYSFSDLGDKFRVFRAVPAVGAMAGAAPSGASRKVDDAASFGCDQRPFVTLEEEAIPWYAAEAHLVLKGAAPKGANVF